MIGAPPSEVAVESMATTIAFAFPVGRYHATAMGTSANDGVVEWPPSPWRLLRALYSVWQTRFPELEPDQVEPLLAALATAPDYHVDPRTSIGHTRHYMPGETSGNEITTLVHDTFVVCAPDRPTLHVTWPTVELSEEQRSVLGRLCSGLTWLGRAESLVDARLLEPGEPRPEPNSFVVPADGSTTTGSPIRLLVPTMPLDLEALTVDLQQMRSNAKTRATLPPKAALRTYVRPSPESVRRPPRRIRRRPQPTAVRLTVVPVEPRRTGAEQRQTGSVVRAVESSRSAARLPLADVVVHASALRRAAMSVFGQLNGHEGSPTLSGRDGAGPRRGHNHAHYLPIPPDRSSTSGTFISSFLVWAPEGLGDAELEALRRLRHVEAWQWVSASRTFRVVADGVGTPANLAPGLTAASASGRAWTSVTPVVPGRHPHRDRTWAQQVELEIRRDLVDRGLPEAEIALEPWNGPFTTVRPRAGRPSHRAHNARFNATLTFSEPLTDIGPVCLGAQSHFGLGLFRPTGGTHT